MAQRQEPGFGIMVFDDRLSPSVLADVGPTDDDSAYTESGPNPGQPPIAGPWRPYMTDAQSVSVDLFTVRGGFSGRKGACVIYKLSSETTSNTSWRSWNTPGLITGVTGPEEAWGAASDLQGFAIATSYQTGNLFIAARDSTNLEILIWRHEPLTQGWTLLQVATDLGIPTADVGLNLVCDRDTGTGLDRLILFVTGLTSGSGGRFSDVALFSDDQGDSWALYQRATWLDDAQTTTPTMAAQTGADWLALCGAEGQWASSDHGATWNQVSSTTLTTVTDCCPLPGGGYLAVRREPGTNFPTVRLLSSARADFQTATAITLVSTAMSADPRCCIDDDGVLYVIAQDDGLFYIWWSRDGGVTWDAVPWPWLDQGGSASATEMSVHGLVAAYGALWVVAQGAVAATDGVMVLIRLGGWSNVEQSNSDEDSQADPAARFTWAENANTSYVPLDLPGQYGWTVTTGAGGTESLTTSNDPALTVAGTQLSFQRYDSGTVAIKASQGQAVTAAINWRCSSATPNLPAGFAASQSGIELTLTMGTLANLFEIALYLGPDGIRVQDSAGILGTQVALDGTLNTEVLLQISSNNECSAWWRQTNFGLFERFVDEVAITAGAASAARTARIQWGKRVGTVAGSTTLFTRYVGMCPGGAWRQELEDRLNIGGIDDAPTAARRGMAHGKAIPTRPFAYPLPEATTAGEFRGRVAGSGGPTKYGDVATLPVRYTFPISAIDPLVSPSPRRPWKAANDDEVRLTWEFPGASDENAPWLGSAVGLLVLGAPRPRLWQLERDDGTGIGFEPMGTLDLALGTGLTFQRQGSVIMPDSGTLDIPRYIRENELVTGYVVHGGGAREVVANSGGYWTADTSVQQIRVTVGGTVATDPENGGNLQIICPRGLMVVYPLTDLVRTRWRVKVDAGQFTPDLQYRCGLLAIGRIIGVGGDPAWTWSSTDRFSRRVAVSADNVVSVRELGPPARDIRYSWPGGAPMHLVRPTDTARSDFGRAVGSVDSLRHIGTGQDQAAIIQGLSRTMRSGEVPICVIPRLELTTGITELDWSKFAYGRATGGVSVQGVVGTEGFDEVVTVTELLLQEIV